MADDHRPINGTSVTLRDLENLSLQIKNTTDRIFDKIENMQKWQEEYREKINKNADEILLLRQRAHDNANGIQALELRTAPLSLVLSTELVSGMVEIRRSIEMVRTSDVKVPLKQTEVDRLRDLLKQDAEEEIGFIKRLRDEEIDKRAAYIQKLEDAEALRVVEETGKFLAARKKREQRWFGLSREVVVGALGLLIFLILTTIWAWARAKYLGLP